VRGEVRPPRDKKRLRFLFSALQSQLFNDLLDRRVANDSWARVLPGDLAKKHDSGGLFAVPLAGAELEDAQARAAAGQISATGPMFGASMRTPQGAVLELEQAVLEASGLRLEQLAAFRNAGEGTRRPLRLLADELQWELGDKSIELGFVLPKGGYATTLLENVFRLAEDRAPATEAEPLTTLSGSPDLGSDDREHSTFPQ
jgi:tRNA pseudouridine13 synthase